MIFGQIWTNSHNTQINKYLKYIGKILEIYKINAF